MDVKFILSKYSPSLSKDIFPFEFRTNPNVQKKNMKLKKI